MRSRRWLGCVTVERKDIDHAIVIEVDIAFVLDIERKDQAAIDGDDGAVTSIMNRARSFETVGDVFINRFLDARLLERSAGKGLSRR